MSADAMEAAILFCSIIEKKGHWQVWDGAEVVAKDIVSMVQAYGDACRLDGARKGLDRAAKFMGADIWDTHSPHYLCENPATAIRALSPETVCGGK